MNGLDPRKKHQILSHVHGIEFDLRLPVRAREGLEGRSASGQGLGRQHLKTCKNLNFGDLTPKTNTFLAHAFAQIEVHSGQQKKGFANQSVVH